MLVNPFDPLLPGMLNGNNKNGPTVAQWVKLVYGPDPWQGSKWLWCSFLHHLCFGLLFSQFAAGCVPTGSLLGLVCITLSGLDYSIAQSLLASLAAEALTCDHTCRDLCQNLRAMVSQLCPRLCCPHVPTPSCSKSYRLLPEGGLLTLRGDCSLPQGPFPSQNLLSPQKNPCSLY